MITSIGEPASSKSDHYSLFAKLRNKFHAAHLIVSIYDYVAANHRGIGQIFCRKVVGQYTRCSNKSCSDFGDKTTKSPSSSTSIGDQWRIHSVICHELCVCRVIHVAPRY